MINEQEKSSTGFNYISSNYNYVQQIIFETEHKEIGKCHYNSIDMLLSITSIIKLIHTVS